MCCIIFSELKKLNAKFFGKGRIVTQSKFSRKVWFQVFISQRIFPKTYFQHKVYRQSSVWFSFFTQDFSVTISINFFRKNRREVFGVSSENMLHTTCCSLAKLRQLMIYVNKYTEKFERKNLTSKKNCKHCRSLIKTDLAILPNCC